MKLFKILTNLEKPLYWPLVSGYFSRISQTKYKNKNKKNSVAYPDPGSGAVLFDPQDPGGGEGSGAFVTPGSRMGKISGSGIRDEQPGSATLKKALFHQRF